MVVVYLTTRCSSCDVTNRHAYLIKREQKYVCYNQEPIESNDKGACNCVLRNVDGEIQTWRPILFLVSLHIAMYG